MKFYLLSYLKIILLCYTIFVCNFLPAQTQGPLSPSSNATNTSIGTISWNFGIDSYSSNDVRAYSGAMSSGDESYYLVLTDFGFSIPSTVNVDGIFVEIEKRDNGSGNIKDKSIMIVKGGSIVGAEHAAGGNWSSSDVYKTYGGATDLWGTTWAYSDINALDFGIAISCQKAGPSTNQGEIDHVRITIYYSSPLPVELLSFYASPAENTIELRWETASETNNDYFIVERSQNGSDFQKIDTVKGAGNSSLYKTYYVIDNKPNDGINYYRLTQVDFDGRSKTFEIVLCNLSSEDSEILMTTYDVSGKLFFSGKTNYSKIMELLSNYRLPLGTYVIVATRPNVTYSTKKVIITEN